MKELFVELLFAFIVIAFLNNAVVEGQKSALTENGPGAVEVRAALVEPSPGQAPFSAPIPLKRSDFL